MGIKEKGRKALVFLGTSRSEKHGIQSSEYIVILFVSIVCFPPTACRKVGRKEKKKASVIFLEIACESSFYYLKSSSLSSHLKNLSPNAVLHRELRKYGLVTEEKKNYLAA